MSNIYNFPVVNLRKEVSEGYVSKGTKELIEKVLIELSEFHPNSWDKTFCEDMLGNTKTLSDKQIVQLERILHDILSKTEHPSFTPQIDFSVLDQPDQAPPPESTAKE